MLVGKKQWKPQEYLSNYPLPLIINRCIVELEGRKVPG